MRYTHYDADLGRYVVPCLYTVGGDRITFHIKKEPAEKITNNKGDILLAPGLELVFGEVIDRLAELENREEIVRCKDCKSYSGEGKCRNCNLWRNPEDFCSRGKKKEDET